MRILVTNDDGIEAPGLHAVASALHEAGHQIEVAAPRTDRSGSGSSLGAIHDGARVGFAEHILPGLEGIRAVSFDAPPAFAALAFCTGVFGPRPDLVVSGINDGFNTGRLILSSSTVGAALTAAALGARGLAVSAGFAPDHRFDTAARVTCETVAWMIEHSAPYTVLNVNVPNLDVADLRGVRGALLASRSLMGLRLEKRASTLHLHRFENTRSLGSDTDSALVQDGYVAISVLTPVSTHAVDPQPGLADFVQSALLVSAR